MEDPAINHAKHIEDIKPTKITCPGKTQNMLTHFKEFQTLQVDILPARSMSRGTRRRRGRRRRRRRRRRRTRRRRRRRKRMANVRQRQMRRLRALAQWWPVEPR